MTTSIRQPIRAAFCVLAFVVLALGAPGDWRRLVAARRDRYEREKQRRAIPRLLLSDGTAIYRGIGGDSGGAEDGLLEGSPVL